MTHAHNLPSSHLRRKSKGKGTMGPEQKRSLRGEPRHSLNSKQNPCHLLKSEGKAVNLSESESSPPATKQVPASPWDGQCRLPGLFFHFGAYCVSRYSFHLSFLLVRTLSGGAKLNCILVFHGSPNPSYHLT